MAIGGGREDAHGPPLASRTDDEPGGVTLGVASYLHRDGRIPLGRVREIIRFPAQGAEPVPQGRAGRKGSLWPPGRPTGRVRPPPLLRVAGTLSRDAAAPRGTKDGPAPAWVPRLTTPTLREYPGCSLARIACQSSDLNAISSQICAHYIDNLVLSSL